jgi:hypothetical protein
MTDTARYAADLAAARANLDRVTAAYEIAARVWDRVKAAATFGEAWSILTNAGWKGHYYCRVD